MRRVTAGRAVAAGVLYSLAFVCVFGFLAAQEPGPQSRAFAIGYATVGLTAAVAATWLLFKR